MATLSDSLPDDLATLSDSLPNAQETLFNSLLDAYPIEVLNLCLVGGG
jgi:hypothetical protein